MADDLRKLIADGEKLGFTYLGQHARGGHLQFVHESGQKLTASSTPSDSHAWINTRKDMERISGRQLPRDNKAKYTFKRVDCANFERSEIEVENSGVVESLIARVESVRSEFQSLVGLPNRSSAQKARKLIMEFNELRDELADHHRIVDPIY